MAASRLAMCALIYAMLVVYSGACAVACNIISSLGSICSPYMKPATEIYLYYVEEKWKHVAMMFQAAKTEYVFR